MVAREKGKVESQVMPHRAPSVDLMTPIGMAKVLGQGRNGFVVDRAGKRQQFEWHEVDRF